jgi:hypothetical protein
MSVGLHRFAPSQGRFGHAAKMAVQRWGERVKEQGNGPGERGIAEKQTNGSNVTPSCLTRVLG